MAWPAMNPCARPRAIASRSRTASSAQGAREDHVQDDIGVEQDREGAGRHASAAAVLARQMFPVLHAIGVGAGGDTEEPSNRGHQLPHRRLERKRADAVELQVTELEERIAPSCAGGKHLPTGGITV
jgi:hypothetical protein